MNRKIFFLIIILLFASSVYAKVRIVISIPPLYNITKAIAGDTVDITLIIPPGVSPHTFSPRPSQLKELTQADIFIQIGASLEFWAPKMLEASANEKLKVINLSDGIQLIAEKEHGEKDEHGEHEHSSGNPHIWLDPILVKDMAEKIYDELSSMDPGQDKNKLKDNYYAFREELDKLNKYLTDEIKKFKIKEIISFHPAWAYFERRYGLKELGVIQTSPGKEPSIREIREIIKQIKEYKITAIFAEPQLPRKAADVIASEASVKVLILDPLGSVDENGSRGYINLIKSNFKIMQEALK